MAGRQRQVVLVLFGDKAINLLRTDNILAKTQFEVIGNWGRTQVQGDSRCSQEPPPAGESLTLRMHWTRGAARHATEWEYKIVTLATRTPPVL
jgi:hypothetical protein